MKPLGAELRQIDLVHHVVEMGRIAANHGGQVVHRRHDRVAILSLDHHEDVFLVAKFLGVLQPVAVVFRRGVQNIVAIGVEFEVVVGDAHGPGGGQQPRHDREQREPDDQPSDGGQRS